MFSGHLVFTRLVELLPRHGSMLASALAGAEYQVPRPVPAVAEAAEMLANTPTVCQNYYLHPGMISEFEAGTLPRLFQRYSPRPRSSLPIDEQILMRFLRHWKPSANSHAE